MQNLYASTKKRSAPKKPIAVLHDTVNVEVYDDGDILLDLTGQVGQPYIQIGRELLAQIAQKAKVAPTSLLLDLDGLPATLQRHAKAFAVAHARLQSGRIAQIRKEPDGRWSANIYAPDGTAKREYFATRKEARQAVWANQAMFETA